MSGAHRAEPASSTRTSVFFILILLLASQWARANVTKGDFNRDGVFDSNDLAAFAQAYYDRQSFLDHHQDLSAADLLAIGDWDNDGVFNFRDARELRRALAHQAWLGVEPKDDFNNDGQVDATDEKALRAARSQARRQALFDYKEALVGSKLQARRNKQLRREDELTRTTKTDSNADSSDNSTDSNLTSAPLDSKDKSGKLKFEDGTSPPTPLHPHGDRTELNPDGDGGGDGEVDGGGDGEVDGGGDGEVDGVETVK